MIHPHNPVMRRIGEMAGRWKEEVMPRHRLIRWMLRPEDSRMYEGFCRLEASPHGQLDNLFVFFYTPFLERETFSYSLMTDWLQEVATGSEQLTAAGVTGHWEVALFHAAVDSHDYAACDLLLPKMVDSYRTWLGMPDREIVLALLPKQMTAPAAFNAWLSRWMAPDGVQLLVFDHSPGNFWGETFGRLGEAGCTLHHDLKMQEAIKEIATAGAATDPQAAFRECLFEMGAASVAKDRARVQDWGEKALVLGKKSGDAVLLATAYLAYAGMLFSFKAHEKITALLDAGMAVCRNSLKDTMQSMLLQYYAYKGSHCQLRKQRKEALDWFMQMGTAAEGFGYWGQAVSAYYKAFVFARYKGFDEEKSAAVERAMGLTDRLTIEEIVAGEYPFMARESGSEAVEAKMTEAFGEDWRQTVDELEKNYTRQKSLSLCM